jgi:hypothetical protein
VFRKYPVPALPAESELSEQIVHRRPCGR